MAAVVVTKENFEEVVLKSELPVLVDFWAEWCGPCKMLLPVIDKVAGELEGKALICKVNVDDQADLATQFRVMSIPTLLVFKDGQVANKSIGVISAAEVVKLLGL